MSLTQWKPRTQGERNTVDLEKGQVKLVQVRRRFAGRDCVVVAVVDSLSDRLVLPVGDDPLVACVT